MKKRFTIFSAILLLAFTLILGASSAQADLYVNSTATRAPEAGQKPLLFAKYKLPSMRRLPGIQFTSCPEPMTKP